MPSAPHVGGNGSRTLRLTMLHRVEHFEGKVIAAGSKFANGRPDQVVSNDRRNCSCQTRSGRDQSFGDTRRNCTKRCRACRTEAVKSIDNSPHSSEQPHKRCYRSSNRQPRNVPLEPRNFLRRSDLHTALDRHQASYSPGRRYLAAVFFVSALEHSNQRAGLELVRHGGNILQALCLPEGPHEAATLRTSALEQAPFREDNRPRDQAERQK